MEIFIAFESNGLSIQSDSKLSDLECASHVMSLKEDPHQVQVFLEYLNDIINMFRMRLASSGFGLFKNWVSNKMNPILVEQECS